LDGTYDHGAVTATLQSPELVLPTGNAVLQLTVGLYAAVSTCNDRLEIWLDNTLVDTLCGPVEPTTFSYGLVGGDTHQLRLVFISDATENSGAGPLLKHLQWVRSEPDLCGPDDTEQVVPEPTTGLQRAPVITLADTGWKAFWHDEAGVWRRTLDEGAKPSAPQALLESNAQHVSAAGPWVAWERPETHQIIVQGPNNTRTIGTEQTLFAPAISAKGALAYLESQGEYTSLYQLNDPFTADQAAELIHTTSSVSAPRVTIHNENTRLVVRVGQSILLSSATSDELETVATQSAFERPDLASGHQRLVIVWAQANHLMAQSEGEAIEISSVSPPRSPVVVATQSGWFVAWTAQGPDDTGVAAALLPPDASTALGLASVSAYTFANQDSIALAPDGGGALAIWRSDWLDGDASGVVLRRLQASPLP
jgi:hypothetical protein